MPIVPKDTRYLFGPGRRFKPSVSPRIARPPLLPRRQRRRFTGNSRNVGIDFTQGNANNS